MTIQKKISYVWDYFTYPDWVKWGYNILNSYKFIDKPLTANDVHLHLLERYKIKTIKY